MIESPDIGNFVSFRNFCNEHVFLKKFEIIHVQNDDYDSIKMSNIIKEIGLKKNYLILLLCYFISFSFISLVFAADTILLNNGKVIEGIIVKQTEHYVEINIGSSEPREFFLFEDIKEMNGKPISSSHSNKKRSLKDRLSEIFQKKSDGPNINYIDVVTLKSGDVVEGKLISQCDTYIIIKPLDGGLRIELLREQILSLGKRIPEGQEAVSDVIVVDSDDDQ